MDHFGIGTAIVGALRVYFTAARRTGRTTAMLDGLQPGDRIIFATEQERHHTQMLMAERGLKNRTIFAAPGDFTKVAGFGTRWSYNL